MVVFSMYSKYLVVVFILFQMNEVSLVLKYWKGNDIINSLILEGTNDMKGCKGLIFPEQFQGRLSIGNISTSQIILPKEYGVIEIIDEVLFDPWETKCKRVKEVNFVQWLTPNYWKIFPAGNPSIPHSERVPCYYDDVLFENSIPFSIEFPPVDTLVRSVTFGGTKGVNKLDNDEWQYFLFHWEEASYQFSRNPNYPPVTIEINPQGCTDKRGCLCHKQTDDYDLILDTVCKNLEEDSSPTNCVKPIQPVGHCTKICGGIIHLELDDHFEMEKLKALIPVDKSVFIYVSNFIKNNKLFSQIVFTEEENNYQEKSSKKAEQFYNYLVTKENKRLGFKSASVQLSGEFYLRKSYVGHVFSILLATFLSVISFFIIIIVFFSKNDGSSLINRINWFSHKPLHLRDNRRNFTFARFENNQEENLSLATSVLSLDRSFDNPLYEINNAQESEKDESFTLDNKVLEDDNLKSQNLNEVEISSESTKENFPKN